jgi:hypothetical protein
VRWTYAPADTFWVRVIGRNEWVADCCDIGCLSYHGPSVGTFDNEAEAKSAVIAHRRWHRAQEALECGSPCPTCGTPSHRRADFLDRLQKAEVQS